MQHATHITFHVSRFTLLPPLPLPLRPGPHEQADAGDRARDAAAAGLLAAPASALHHHLEFGCGEGSLPGTERGVECVDFPGPTKRRRSQFAGRAVAGASAVECPYFIRALRNPDAMACQARSLLSPSA